MLSESEIKASHEAELDIHHTLYMLSKINRVLIY